VLYKTLATAAGRIGATVRLEEKGMYGESLRYGLREVLITRGRRRVRCRFHRGEGRVTHLRSLPDLLPTSGHQFTWPARRLVSIQAALHHLLPAEDMEDNGRRVRLAWSSDSFGRVGAYVSVGAGLVAHAPVTDQAVVQSLLHFDMPAGVFLDWLEDEGILP
jgi:hypothetical protein